MVAANALQCTSPAQGPAWYSLPIPERRLCSLSLGGTFRILLSQVSRGHDPTCSRPDRIPCERCAGHSGQFTTLRYYCCLVTILRATDPFYRTSFRRTRPLLIVPTRRPQYHRMHNTLLAAHLMEAQTSATVTRVIATLLDVRWAGRRTP